MKNVQKPLVFVGQNEDACFCAMNALDIDLGGVLGAILVQFWGPSWVGKGSQDRPRQDKSGQGRTRQVESRVE